MHAAKRHGRLCVAAAWAIYAPGASWPGARRVTTPRLDCEASKLPGQYLRTPDEHQAGISTGGGLLGDMISRTARRLERGSQKACTRTEPGYMRSKRPLQLSRSTISRQGESLRLQRGIRASTSPAHSEAPAPISAPTTSLTASRLAPTPPPSPTPRVRLVRSRALLALRLGPLELLDRLKFVNRMRTHLCRHTRAGSFAHRLPSRAGVCSFARPPAI